MVNEAKQNISERIEAEDETDKILQSVRSQRDEQPVLRPLFHPHQQHLFSPHNSSATSYIHVL